LADSRHFSERLMLGKILALQEDPQQDHLEQEAGMKVHCSLRVRRRCRKAGGDSPSDPARLARNAALPGEECNSTVSPIQNRSFLSGIPTDGRHIGGITGGIQLVARWAARYFSSVSPMQPGSWLSHSWATATGLPSHERERLSSRYGRACFF
jgi:hypothetical protein